jgi:3-hydroxyisobutyrate dehydrogenase-like beta-hydroxyacid dehydrogenase
MTDVSMIGCGNMGSAMVAALRDAGSEVTAWNRTRQKAEALRGPRVAVADTVAEALEASPVVLVSVTDYEATRAALEGAERRVAGRTLVQLSNGTPDAARSLADTVADAGGEYLDGTVLSYPHAVGTEEMYVVYGGDRETFEATRPLLEQLGGAVEHLGEDPGLPSALDLAAVPPAMRMAIAIWQGAKVCEIEGVPFDTFAEVIRGLVPVIAEDALRKAADPDLPEDPEKVEISVRQAAEDVPRPIGYYESLGLDASVFRALQRLFEAGVEAGRGDHDISCVGELRGAEEAPGPS